MTNRISKNEKTGRTGKSSSLTEAIIEMADDQYRLGMLNKAAYEKITIRLLGTGALSTAKPLSGEEIRKLREQANLSQAVFARYLNLTPGYISQLERGAKQPKGPALTLLNVIRRKGIEAIL
jgi:putative transcriptional regulator